MLDEARENGHSLDSHPSRMIFGKAKHGKRLAFHDICHVSYAQSSHLDRA